MQALGITAVEVNEQLRDAESRCRRRPRAGRRRRAGDPRARRRAHRGGPRRHADHAARAARFARLRDLADVHDGVGGDAHHRAPERPPRHHLRRDQEQGLLGRAVLQASRRPSSPRSATRIRQVKMTQIFTTVDLHQAHLPLRARARCIEGSVLAVLVVWLFLRDMRATLISALAIPLSAIPTFAFMQWMGFTLNSDQPAGAVAGGRRAGGRCHRRDREHRAPHAHGQERLPGGARCRRPDRPGGGRDLLRPSSRCSCR